MRRDRPGVGEWQRVGDITKKEIPHRGNVRDSLDLQFQDTFYKISLQVDFCWQIIWFCWSLLKRWWDLSWLDKLNVHVWSYFNIHLNQNISISTWIRLTTNSDSRSQIQSSSRQSEVTFLNYFLFCLAKKKHFHQTMLLKIPQKEKRLEKATLDPSILKSSLCRWPSETGHHTTINGPGKWQYHRNIWIKAKSFLKLVFAA